MNFPISCYPTIEHSGNTTPNSSSIENNNWPMSVRRLQLVRGQDTAGNLARYHSKLLIIVNYNGVASTDTEN